MTVNVYAWALDAEIGDSLVYANKRAEEEVTLSTRASLNTAFKAHEEGLVFLCQERRGEAFDYIAQRISAPTARILKLRVRTRA